MFFKNIKKNGKIIKKFNKKSFKPQWWMFDPIVRRNMLVRQVKNKVILLNNWFKSNSNKSLRHIYLSTKKRKIYNELWFLFTNYCNNWILLNTCFYIVKYFRSLTNEFSWKFNKRSYWKLYIIRSLYNKYYKRLKTKKIKKFHKTNISFIKLYITFSKKNAFFNITESGGKTLHLTTIRQLGYVGRRSVEKASLVSTIQHVKNILYNYQYKYLAVYYSGFHRHRFTIKKALEKRTFKFKILYVKYILKASHNGCRLSKSKNRRRTRRFYFRDKSENK